MDTQNGCIECSIELNDEVKSRIFTSPKTGRKYLIFSIREKKTADQYGKTHDILIREKDATGNWQSKFIGNGAFRAFQQKAAPSAPAAPAPAPTAPKDNGDDLPW